MKKVLSVVLAVMMLASLSVFAFADDVVNPSVTTKAAPEVEEFEVEGFDGEVEVDLTAAATELPEDATDEEKAAFEEKKDAVNEAIAAVSDDAALAAIIRGALPVESEKESADVYDTAEDAVPAVSDVFYFDAKDENGESILAHEYVEGETPAVKVWVKIELPDNLMKVVQLVGDTWVEVPVVLNENGETGLEFSYAGPVLFVYNSNVEKG